MASVLNLFFLGCLCAFSSAVGEERHFGFYPGQQYQYYYRPSPPRQPQQPIYSNVFGYLDVLPSYFYNNYICNRFGSGYYQPSYGAPLSHAFYYIYRGKRDVTYTNSRLKQYAVVQGVYKNLAQYWEKSDRNQLLKDVVRVTMNMAQDHAKELTAVDVLKQIVQEKMVATQQSGNVQEVYDAMKGLRSLGQDQVKYALFGYVQNSCGNVGGNFYCRYLSRMARGNHCVSSFFSRQLLNQCCRSPAPPPPRPPVVVTPKPTTTTTTTTTVAPTTKQCGISTKNPAKRFLDFTAVTTKLRIVGGLNTEECEYPWMVRLQVGNDLCGGTIIDETHVMTAAHCIGTNTASDMTVNVGEYDYSKTETQDQAVGVSKVTVHPNYQLDDGSAKNDIAILTLDKPLTFNDCVQPVCLPDVGDSSALDNAQCTVTGWGTTSYGGQTSPVLQEVTIPTYSGALCDAQFPNTTPTDPSVQICAGRPFGGADSCQGDSGGPLFCPVNGQYVQYGIVSYGDGCAIAGNAGVYTDVSAMTDFINSVTQ